MKQWIFLFLLLIPFAGAYQVNYIGSAMDNGISNYFPASAFEISVFKPTEETAIVSGQGGMPSRYITLNVTVLKSNEPQGNTIDANITIKNRDQIYHNVNVTYFLVDPEGNNYSMNSTILKRLSYQDVTIPVKIKLPYVSRIGNWTVKATLQTSPYQKRLEAKDNLRVYFGYFWLILIILAITARLYYNERGQRKNAKKTNDPDPTTHNTAS